MMKIIFVIVLSVLVLDMIDCLPVDRRKNLRYLEQSSEYGPAFDEIIVNSSLNIRKKNQTRIARQTPNFPGFPAFPAFQLGAAAGSGQAQAFNSMGPVANFGAASSGSQTQSFNVGPGGVSTSVGLAASQQYNINGMQIDINVSEAFSNAATAAAKGTGHGDGVSITITGLDGKKKHLK